MGLRALCRRLERLTEKRREKRTARNGESVSYPSLTPAQESLLEKAMQAIRRQLRAEGVPEGTPVSIMRFHQAILASSEASEYAHLLYESGCGIAQPPLPCGLKEINV